MSRHYHLALDRTKEAHTLLDSARQEVITVRPGGQQHHERKPRCQSDAAPGTSAPTRDKASRPWCRRQRLRQTLLHGAPEAARIANGQMAPQERCQAGVQVGPHQQRHLVAEFRLDAFVVR